MMISCASFSFKKRHPRVDCGLHVTLKLTVSSFPERQGWSSSY